MQNLSLLWYFSFPAKRMYFMPGGGAFFVFIRFVFRSTYFSESKITYSALRKQLIYFKLRVHSQTETIFAVTFLLFPSHCLARYTCSRVFFVLCFLRKFRFANPKLSKTVTVPSSQVESFILEHVLPSANPRCYLPDVCS